MTSGPNSHIALATLSPGRRCSGRRQVESWYILPISQCVFILAIDARVSSAASKEGDTILTIANHFMHTPSG